MTLCFFMLIQGALAGVELETIPRVGDETAVTLTDDLMRPQAGVTVRVIHRPSLDNSRELAIGITDSRGRVYWTPDQSGVAQIAAGDHRLPITISWKQPPPTTVTLLALLLVGGLVALVWGLLRGPTRRRLG